MVWSTPCGPIYRQLPRNYLYESVVTVSNTAGALLRSPRTFSELPGIESSACLTISKIFRHCELNPFLPSSHMRISTIPNVQSPHWCSTSARNLVRWKLPPFFNSFLSRATCIPDNMHLCVCFGQRQGIAPWYGWALTDTSRHFAGDPSFDSALIFMLRCVPRLMPFLTIAW